MKRQLRWSEYLIFLIPFVSFIIGYACSYLFFSKQRVAVPRIVGSSVQDGVCALSKVGLGLRVRAAREDALLPDGLIVEQIPHAGQSLQSQQSVYVIVSRKPTSLKVPDVWGKYEKDMLALAQEHGIAVDCIPVINKYPVGMCYAQSPVPDTSFEAKKMHVCVSAGADTMAIVPSCIGISIQKIQENMRERDVSYQLEHVDCQEHDHDCRACVVVAQFPLAGSIVRLDRNFSMRLRVGQRL